MYFTFNGSPPISQHLRSKLIVIVTKKIAEIMFQVPQQDLDHLVSSREPRRIIDSFECGRSGV
jgi:hypothetical protein